MNKSTSYIFEQNTNLALNFTIKTHKKQMTARPGMVVDICNPRTQETKAGGLRV
jgi:hypothetical protein